ncbi:hypothetical protein [Microbacterium sp. 2FI]|uniref:hypothetical protein n=1 Tax=Microbacterium sp. 2FI TaxID=2502193 RepID=UPI0010F5F651|nr:hypothetical protein [Microbacterium sp. 2FI]
MAARRVIGGAAVIVLATLFASCATPPRADPLSASSPSVVGDEVVDLLTTEFPVTVLDDGDGAELCLGGVLESLPPQCGGPLLVGWDWSDVEGAYEEESGTRWGSFVVTGTYDSAADEFTPTDVVRRDDWDGPNLGRTNFTTPCAEPEGGWKPLDASRTTTAAMEAVLAAAAAMDGYVTSWMDQSRNPASDPEVLATLTPEEEMSLMNDPQYVIVNVRVTGDTAAATAELRRHWGGMLCVTKGVRTDAELRDVQDEITSSFDGLLSVGVDGIAEVVEVTVVYDDGDLQARFDEEFGTEMVEVSGVLVPAG